LLIKTSLPTFVHGGPPNVTEQVNELIRRRGLQNLSRAPYFIFDDHIPAQAMPRLYRASDAFVLPSRGEGGSARPMLEAMAMGLPVIATDTEIPRPLRLCCAFPLKSVAEMVPADGDFGDFAMPTTTAAEGAHGVHGHRWRRPNVAQLAALMRQIASHPAEARALGAAARSKVIERYSEQALARRLAPRLAALSTKARATSRMAAAAAGHSPRNAGSRQRLAARSSWLEGLRSAAGTLLRSAESSELASALVDLPVRVRMAYGRGGHDLQLYRLWTEPGPFAGCNLLGHGSSPAVAVAGLARVELQRCLDGLAGGSGEVREEPPLRAKGGELGRELVFGRALWCLSKSLAARTSPDLAATATVLELFAKDGGGSTLLVADGLFRGRRQQGPVREGQMAHRPLLVTFEAQIERALAAKAILRGHLHAHHGAPDEAVRIVDVRAGLVDSAVADVRAATRKDAASLRQAIREASVRGKGSVALVVAGAPHHLHPELEDDLSLGVVACQALIAAGGGALGLLVLDPSSPTVETLLLLRHCRPRYVLVHNTNLEHHSGWVARLLLEGGPSPGRYRYTPLADWRAARPGGRGPFAPVLGGTHELPGVAGEGAAHRGGHSAERQWLLLVRAGICPEDDAPAYVA